MKQRNTRKVVSAVPYVALNNRTRWRMQLECGHTVTRAEAKADASCEECA